MAGLARKKDTSEKDMPSKTNRQSKAKRSTVAHTPVGNRRNAAMLKRAAAVYARLLEGDANRDELIAHVRATVGTEAYGRAPEDALAHDLEQIPNQSTA
jgi:hypothetical protein